MDDVENDGEGRFLHGDDVENDSQERFLQHPWRIFYSIPYR